MTFYDRGVKRDGPPIPGGHRPITTAEGDAEFDAAIGERRFQDAHPSRPGGRIARPEPIAVVGAGSSINAPQGTAGRQRGTGAGARFG